MIESMFLIFQNIRIESHEFSMDLSKPDARFLSADQSPRFVYATNGTKKHCIELSVLLLLIFNIAVHFESLKMFQMFFNSGFQTSGKY